MSIVGYRVGEAQVWWLKGCCVWVEVARCLCAAGPDEDVLPCRDRWEEAWAMSVWVVVGRWLEGG